MPSQNSLKRISKNPIISTFLVFASIVVFVLMGIPWLLLIFPVVNAGLPGLRSALWLFRNDVNKARASSCFWFYLAACGWNMARTAFVVLLGVAIFTGIVGELSVERFALVMAGIGLGTLSCTLLGIIAIFRAFRSKCPVFVAPHLFAMCKGDFGEIPTTLTHKHAFNYAVFVLATTLTIPFLSLWIYVLCRLLDGNESTVLWTIFAISPYATIPFLYFLLSRRVVARSPRDCWPDLWSSSPARDAFGSMLAMEDGR